MNEVVESCLGAGITLLLCAVAAWWKSHQARKDGKGKEASMKWLAAGGMLAAAGIGTGAGALGFLPILDTPIGIFRLWEFVVAVFAFLFAMEMGGYRDHHTRTPILGTITVFVFALAVGTGIVNWSTVQIHHAQVTGILQQKSGK